MIETAKKLFNRLSITIKIALIVIPSGIIGLSIIFIATIRNEWMVMKKNLEENISVHTMIIGSNSIPALIFNDSKAVKENLSSLFVSPNIVTAALYDTSGKLFVSYFKNDSHKTLILSDPP